jgi:hypothetical protein
MPTDVAHAKRTPAQVLADMTRLSARELDTVIERAAILRLQKRKLVMSPRESKLLSIINRGLGPKRTARLEQLQAKLRDEDMTPVENKELLRLTDELEKLGAERLQALIELAGLRKITVEQLMRELCVTDHAYA